MPMLPAPFGGNQGGGLGQSIFGQGFNQNTLGQGLGGIFGGLSNLLGLGGDPYGDAMKKYQQYNQQAQNTLNPFVQGGMGAYGGMKNPTQFVNNLMGQYQQSPYNQYLQDQAMHMAQNMGSATGMTGSTPLMQFAQQNAQNIAGGGLQDWMNQILGINQNLYNGGLQAAGQQSNLQNQLGQQMGNGAFNQGMTQQNALSNLFGGIGSLGSMFF